MRQQPGLLACLILACGLPALAADWPAFRGPFGNGVATDETAPTTWDATTNIKWKVKLAAPANSSPIVSAGRVFVTLAQDEGKKRSLYCFDRKDGRELWVRTVEFDKVMPTHITHPYGGSTPASDGRRVVVWHGSAGLHCYDMNGNEQWNRNLGEVRHEWGYASSPVLYKGRVILHHGPTPRAFLVALDLASGQVQWETEEPLNAKGDRRAEDGKYLGSWSTPVIAQIDGRDQVVCAMPTRVVGYDPESGKIVWSCDGLYGDKGSLAYSSPLIGNGLCLMFSGFNGPAIGFKLGGTGDLTPNRLWQRTRQNPQSIGTGVFVDDYVYVPNAAPPTGTIQCIEPRTGKVLWSENTESHWGSIVRAGDLLLVTGQKGTTVVFRPNPKEFKRVASNPLNEPSNSTPAISDGQIFIRTFDHLYCIAQD
jgi:outer membrane protein assembly factor BamB